MTNRVLPFETRISLYEADLAYKWQKINNLSLNLMYMCAGYEQMYESPEKLACMERILETEEKIDALKEEAYEIENWLVDVGARGWGVKL